MAIIFINAKVEQNEHYYCKTEQIVYILSESKTSVNYLFTRIRIIIVQAVTRTQD